ncbi:MAG: efflux RND transporter permease subunit, partial [Cryobacterium sp.]|nr:efflux RND transporter permease subunit [Cryobacterium sp.]
MLEKILHFSLMQRFLVIIATVLMVGMGVFSWNSLTLDAVPDITNNQVTINTNTGGLSPVEVEKLVTFPIESALAGTPGLSDVRSVSQFGLSQITVVFEDQTDVYFARQLINERLQTVRELLPKGVAAPTMGPVSTGLGDIYFYSLESKSRSMIDLRTIQDWQIGPQLRTVKGVAEVAAADGSEKQYQVVVEPRALQARGLTVANVVTALQRNNQNTGGGILERNGERILIRGVGTLEGSSDIEKVVLKTEAGIPILLREVAKVQEGTPVLTGISSRDGHPALIVTVLMLKGQNGKTVSQAVDARVKEIRSQLPLDVTLTTVYNRSDLVGESVHTVEKSLLEGGILVIAVLLLLLGNFRGALIVALAIPLSMLFAIIGMNRFGISGNLMSLGAIDFGLIVDGAVVMIENAVRRLAEAREHKGSTLDRHEVRHTVWESCREVAKPTAFAVTIITVVYLPILALEGTEGKMFKPMAFTVVFALIGALILTMTLIPVLASMFMSGDTKEGRNPVMELLSRIYKPALG